MDRKQILELALQELQRQRAEVEADIQSVQAELQGRGSAVSRTTIVPFADTPTGRKLTAAERKAVSLRMKRYWAAKRAQAAKPAARPKARTMTDAQKKAISLRMKEAWKKRKAAAKAKAK
jgi:hypothetical protein